MEAPTTIGGYGLPRTLDPAARRAGAAALLVDDKFAYEGGVSRLLCVPSTHCLLVAALGGP